MGKSDDGKQRRVSLSFDEFGSGVWFIAWLFTVGFAQLGFGQGLLAVAIWPYFLGAALAP